MKFSDTFFGNLIASRTFGPKQQSLTLYGKDKIFTVDDSRFIISDHLGQIRMQYEYDDGRPVWMGELLKNFALSILLPDKNKLCGSGSENLKNMAVIESAYLSARTGFPEEPGKILHLAPRHSAEPADIRPGRNK
jgi:hypothetical protein